MEKKIIIKEFHQKRKMKVGRKRIKKGKERCVLALHQACTYRQKAPCMYIERKKNFKHASVHKEKNVAKIGVIRICGERKMRRAYWCMHACRSIKKIVKK